MFSNTRQVARDPISRLFGRQESDRSREREADGEVEVGVAAVTLSKTVLLTPFSVAVIAIELPVVCAVTAKLLEVLPGSTTTVAGTVRTGRSIDIPTRTAPADFEVVTVQFVLLPTGI